ncbi:hypothetical protein GF312_02765 [Candidatus Poribacteria bacterium]|nr:hypothetical protein [Candidatus Poribacteria bacterium]
MSEYQYYEFIAIDKPLTKSEMEKLRRLSTRAEITPTRFTNIYNYGDFSGSPDEMMEKYFDAFVYVTNWGFFHFKLRLPLGIVDEEILKPCFVEYTFEYKKTDKHIIISWESRNEYGGYDEWIEGEGWLGRLVPIREELEQGNYTSIYLGWLLAVNFDYYIKSEEYDFDDDDIYRDIVREDLEPPIDLESNKLTAAQKALVEFLHIDTDLVKAALEKVKTETPKIDHEAIINGWLDGLDEKQAKDFLFQILNGNANEALRDIRLQYNTFFRDRIDTKAEVSRRKVGEILEIRKKAKQKRLELRAKNMAKERVEKERRKRKYLVEVMQKASELWNKAEELAKEQNASAYDKARDLLVELSQSYEQFDRKDEFHELMAHFVEKNSRRKALLKRLEKEELIDPDF